ncbi:hypothetical protein B7494_g2831 [Chlorociboria aeruginascens]|nr:hypothetical protein B7494_g2831 [Chlorociboria aeruginascens]
MCNYTYLQCNVPSCPNIVEDCKYELIDKCYLYEHNTPPVFDEYEPSKSPLRALFSREKPGTLLTTEKVKHDHRHGRIIEGKWNDAFHTTCKWHKEKSAENFLRDSLK